MQNPLKYGLAALGVCLLLGSARGEVRCETIPRAAYEYRSTLIRIARSVWGLDAPVAVFAAQIHTESRWRTDVVSSAGAQGLAQFMPSTAAWLPTVAPETGTPAPFNPRWSLRALVTYNYWLHQRTSGQTPYDRMAFTLSAYNGGLGWVIKDKRLAQQQNLNPEQWFDHTEFANSGRRGSAFDENRRYVRLILRARQHDYIRAGWGQGIHESTDGGDRP